MKTRITYLLLVAIFAGCSAYGVYSENNYFVIGGLAGMCMLILLALGAVFDQALRVQGLLHQQTNLLIHYFQQQGVRIDYGSREQDDEPSVRRKA